MADYISRKAIYEQIEKARDSKVVAYVTGDRPGLETQVSPEIVDLFVDHLDAIWPAKRISLVLYTNGGDTAAAWRLINLIRTFCDELEVIVPAKALSAGTLICLGANKIIMTKQATLGPIDPSLNSPLGPIIPGSPNHRAPVSVEAVQGFLDVATNELNIKNDAALAGIWTHLSQQIHPLVLGQIFRTRQQIRTLARKLLEFQKTDSEVIDRIVSFLCSESGSHDHTINRREARGLGLAIENPSQELYDILKALQQDYVEFLSLREPFNPDTLLAGNPQANYAAPRALVESSVFGSHQFLSVGSVVRVEVPNPMGAPQIGFQDMRSFEGWRKEA
ncbi:MAG TPA: hypothetical protein VJM09_11975 [Sphingobium sp.]|nr:hypothetical protein [Sphingobium sp.]